MVTEQRCAYCKLLIGRMDEVVEEDGLVYYRECLDWVKAYSNDD